jgi:hypothetical protein
MESIPAISYMATTIKITESQALTQSDLYNLLLIDYYGYLILRVILSKTSTKWFLINN